MLGAESHAGWKVGWQLPEPGGQGYGLQIIDARFSGKDVLSLGCVPFVMVRFGDGEVLNFGIAGDYPLVSIPWSSPVLMQAVPIGVPIADCIHVAALAAAPDAPATLEVAARFLAGPFQVLHAWSFRADGRIDVEVGVAGLGNAQQKLLPRVYSPHIRLAFALFGGTGHAVDELERVGPPETSSITTTLGLWFPLSEWGRRIVVPAKRTRWRIRTAKQAADKTYPGYDLVQDFGPAPDFDSCSFDFAIGPAPDALMSDLGELVYHADGVLPGGYATLNEKVGAPKVGDTAAVCWLAPRAVHWPAPFGEDAVAPRYHTTGVQCEPRDFLSPLKDIYATDPPSPP